MDKHELDLEMIATIERVTDFMEKATREYYKLRYKLRNGLEWTEEDQLLYEEMRDMFQDINPNF